MTIPVDFQNALSFCRLLTDFDEIKTGGRVCPGAPVLIFWRPLTATNVRENSLQTLIISIHSWSVVFSLYKGVVSVEKIILCPAVTGIDGKHTKASTGTLTDIELRPA